MPSSYQISEWRERSEEVDEEPEGPSPVRSSVESLVRFRGRASGPDMVVGGRETKIRSRAESAQPTR